MWGGHLDSRPVALLGSCDEISHRRLFPQSRQCKPGRRCPFAQASPSPGTRSAHRPPAMVPLTNPNERRSRACSPAKAPPTLAGRGRGPARSGARSPAISRNAPRAAGPASARSSLRGRQWPDSSVTAANWPPVPTSPWGQQPKPQGSCGTRPRGGPKLEVQHGPAPSQARWRWMRHSDREMHADPRVHGALS
jgi:hypothetical protein